MRIIIGVSGLVWCIVFMLISLVKILLLFINELKEFIILYKKLLEINILRRLGGL